MYKDSVCLWERNELFKAGIKYFGKEVVLYILIEFERAV